jgi:hypothetical protein
MLWTVPQTVHLRLLYQTSNPIGVSIIANVYPLVAPLVPIVFLVLQVVQLLAALFIILVLYIRLILIHSSVPWDSLL